MISQKGGFFMFLRAQLSAQMATIADFLVTILLVRLFEVYYVYATLAGAVYGGIVNCVINYKWTFKSTGKKTNVAVKFILVWVCSIWLNTWGTYALTESLAKIPWVRYAQPVFRRLFHYPQNGGSGYRRIILEL